MNLDQKEQSKSMKRKISNNTMPALMNKRQKIQFLEYLELGQNTESSQLLEQKDSYFNKDDTVLRIEDDPVTRFMQSDPVDMVRIDMSKMNLNGTVPKARRRLKL